MPITYKIMTTLIFIIFSITFSNIASHFFSIFLQFCTLILSKQHVIGIKCRNSLPLCTQDNYKHKNKGGKTTMYPWKCLRLYLALGNSTVITVLHTIYTILLTIISDAYMTYNSFKWYIKSQVIMPITYKIMTTLIFHLYRVIKQHVIGIKCRNSLPLRTQDNYKHKNMGCKTAMYPWKSYVILLYDVILTWNIMFRKYINISYNKMTYDFHGYIAVLPPIFLCL
jgi:hypothetical protein